jgi:ureidoglycolate dehydrogenase (NAD+)
MGSINISPQALEDFCVAAMLRLGIRADDAQLTARIVVTTDTWGVHTHGTRQLRNVLKNFPIGRLKAQARAALVKEGLAWALLDGGHALPFVTAHRAMELAIQKAQAAGIGYVGVRHTSHFGAAGYYAVMAAEQNMIGLAMCNADPQVTVPGGRGKILGTNPIAYAAPAGKHRPIFFDIATSAAAANKIIRAKTFGQPIPAGWLADGDGLPTTDASLFPGHAALMPMAGHKGYGFALLVETLAGALTGAAMTKDQPSWVPGVPGDPPGYANQGQTFIAINAEAMMPLPDFDARMAGLADYLHGSPKAKGSDRIYLPGEMEWEKRDAALKDGLHLPSDVVDSLIGLAEDVGLETTPFSSQ